MKKPQQNLTYKSIMKFIKQTNLMPDGKDAEGKKKYVQLREKQISFDDIRIEQK